MGSNQNQYTSNISHQLQENKDVASHRDRRLKEKRRECDRASDTCCEGCKGKTMNIWLNRLNLYFYSLDNIWLKIVLYNYMKAFTKWKINRRHGKTLYGVVRFSSDIRIGSKDKRDQISDRGSRHVSTYGDAGIRCHFISVIIDQGRNRLFESMGLIHRCFRLTEPKNLLWSRGHIRWRRKHSLLPERCNQDICQYWFVLQTYRV